MNGYCKFNSFPRKLIGLPATSQAGPGGRARSITSQGVQKSPLLGAPWAPPGTSRARSPAAAATDDISLRESQGALDAKVLPHIILIE